VAALPDEDSDWEAVLHQCLGAPWPSGRDQGVQCSMVRTDGPILPLSVQVSAEEHSQARATETLVSRGRFWCITRHRGPFAAVETGVARGITSRFILEAMTANGVGGLRSDDLPPPGEARSAGEEIEMAVLVDLQQPWSYVKGSSRRCLRGVLESLGEIDLFLHDSRHSKRNLLFELELARSAVRPSGFLVVDDVDLNCGMHEYRRRHPTDTVLICPAEPRGPDPGRQMIEVCSPSCRPGSDSRGRCAHLGRTALRRSGRAYPRAIAIGGALWSAVS
jgi:Methyltransferase domain